MESNHRPTAKEAVKLPLLYSALSSLSESDKIVTSGFEPEGAKLVRQIKTLKGGKESLCKILLFF